MLARKYRPSTFADLIGQDAMVRTISNAFETGRIPQAWVLTGVRGVGKTTTARILARALNYELPDGSITGPTINMPVLGIHCQAIMESRHLDVIEMDAASHNGVEDVRAINEAIRYAPVSARYKVYILDEVHMLSGAAFNALLKTLEEPPPHAKFVFATTEIRKVPITVLSRCQRFDLRRVDAALLVKHLQGIAAKEAITAEPEALALIARAAEGSVRDALSLLDQAIAHAGASGAGNNNNCRSGARRGRAADARACRPHEDHRPVRSADARRSRRAPCRKCASNTMPAPIRRWCSAISPSSPISSPGSKIVPALADDVSLTEAERTRGRAFAAKLSMRVLARTWQMLLKGIEEVAAAGRPLAAAEMVLVRIAYAADLPTPDEVIRSLGEGARGNGAARRRADAGRRVAAAGPAFRSAARGVRARRNARRARLHRAAPKCRSPMRAAASDAGARAAKLRGAGGARRRETRPRDQERARARRAAGAFRGRPARDRARSKRAKSAHRRTVEKTQRMDRPALDGDRVGRAGQPSLYAQAQMRKAELKDGVRADPLVQAVLARFPGAEIVDVRQPAAGARRR